MHSTSFKSGAVEQGHLRVVVMPTVAVALIEIGTRVATAQERMASTVEQPALLGLSLAQQESSSLFRWLMEDWVITLIPALLSLSLILFLIIRVRTRRNNRAPAREMSSKQFPSKPETNFTSSRQITNLPGPDPIESQTSRVETTDKQDQQTALSQTANASGASHTEMSSENVDPENIKVSRANALSEVNGLSYDELSQIHATLDRAESEVKNLLSGSDYDPAVINSSDPATRRVVSTALLATLAGAGYDQHEVARRAFVEHGYFDEVTLALRAAVAPEERAAAARMLGILCEPLSTPDLCFALFDNSPEVRTSAVRALGQIGNPEAIPALNDLLNRETGEVNEELIRQAINAIAMGEKPEWTKSTPAKPNLRIVEKPPARPEEEAFDEFLGRMNSREEQPTPVLVESADLNAVETPTIEISEEELRLKQEEDALWSALKELEQKRREAEAAKEKAEEDARLKAELEARARAEVEAQILAEEEARRRVAEEAARRKAEEEARAEAEQQARLAAEEEARLRADDEARFRQEAETLRRAAEELARKRAAAQEARKLLEEEARRQAEAERQRIEEEARLQAEEEARRLAEEEACRIEEEARRAEEEARKREAEEIQLRAEQEERARAEEESRRRSEEQRQLREAEEQRRVEGQLLLAEQDLLLKAVAELAKRRAEVEEARKKAEIETQALLAAEQRLRSEEEERQRLELERQQLENDVRRRVEEERKRLEETLRLAEEERKRIEELSRAQTEEQQRRLEELAAVRLRAEEEARQRSEEAESLRAEIEALQRAEQEQLQKIEAETRRRFEVEARLKEEESRYQTEMQARFDLEEQAQRVAEETRVRADAMIERQDGDHEARVNAEQAEEDESHHRVLEDTPESSAGDDVQETKIAETVVAVANSLNEEQSDLPVHLLNRLRSDSSSERASALAEIAALGSDDAFKTITSAFDDLSQDVRNAAAKSLYGLQADRAASFTRALREGSPDRRRRIGKALAESGLASVAIENLLGDSREATYDAFSLLFLMAKAGEVEPLMRAIEEHKDIEARLAVVKLLALSGQPEIIPAFRRLAVRGSLPSEVRSAVMEAIYQISSQTTQLTPSAA